jgi:hypothetical protein
MEKKDKFDLVSYTKPMFNMFKGDPVKAEIIFDISLLNVVFDRFGLNVTIYPVDKNRFKALLDVSISPTFNNGFLLSKEKKANGYSPWPVWLRRIKEVHWIVLQRFMTEWILILQMKYKNKIMRSIY